MSSDDPSAEQMSTRLRHINKILGTLHVHRRSHSSSYRDGEQWLGIGNVKVSTSAPAFPELVPRLYAKPSLSQVTLQHLKWMLQKDALGQDMFLIGLPGPSRRHLAMTFCELTQREVEYVSLSRDTTETDLKQRREIIESTVHYVDQSAVRAALGGRVLVLDGIEKAERNVLPVLNNLLENREMQLDDGRLIVAPERYDALKQEHGEDTLQRWNIARVDEKFRVIALGLPVPPYKGNPLDPPLRSRFQARTIFQTPFQTQLEELRDKYPTLDENMSSSIVSVSTALHTLSQSQLTGGPVDLSYHLDHVVKTLARISTSCPAQLLQSVYPSDLLGTDTLMKDALQKFGLSQVSGTQLFLADAVATNGNIKLIFEDGIGSPSLFAAKERNTHSVEVAGWASGSKDHKSSEFISTQDHSATLAQMLLSHQSADFCLVGGKGTGKTSLVSKFAGVLGYDVEPITLYQDMTSRELLQQRTTLDNGDTSWQLSPLVESALEGRLAILDGIHRVDTSTLAVLKSLIQDRSLNLMDGTRLLNLKCYNATKAAAGLSDADMSDRNIYPIHPKFRLIGIGETHKSSSAGQSGLSPSVATWITPELLSMFQFHHVRPLPVEQEKQIIMSKAPGFGEQSLDTVLRFVHTLRSSQDPTLQSLAISVSTRQLLRIARRLSSYPTQSLYQAINKACLARFLPQMTRNALHQVLSSAGIHPPGKTEIQQHLKPIKCEVKDGYLHIGETSTCIGSSHDAAAMVPNVLFYDNQLHLHIIEDMIKDFSLGEHLLLVGNQGVGKNKIVDRFLHLLNLPREYLQLHRDSTVQTLTLQPAVQSGRVTYQDSPLVRALESGMVLVVDEADKAPTHVTCILKNIIEGSEITLADGRRIIHKSIHNMKSSSHILVHPNFRMIVLANRPGFPFLGNDFFASLGDIFSCHAVDNPDLESEKAMLRQYGESVEDSLLTKLVSAFSELRLMADEGLIAYPYSTREVVNIVRHLQAYPSEGIGSVVRNVFDFDSYNPDLLEVVLKVLHKHGIPAGADRNNIQLAPQYPLSNTKLEGRWFKQTSHTMTPDKSNLKVALQGPFELKSVSVPVERMDTRGHTFSEMKSYCALPLHETNHVSSLCTSTDNVGTQHLHIVTGHPVLLYSLPVHGTIVNCTSLDDFFPSAGGLGYWVPSLIAASLTGRHLDKMLLFERKTDTLLLVKPHQNKVWRVNRDSFVKSVRDMVSWRQKTGNVQSNYQLCQAQDNLIATFKEGSQSVSFIDFSGDSPAGWSMEAPGAVTGLLAVSNRQWILTCRGEDGTEKYYIIDDIRTTPSLSELRVDGISPMAIRNLSQEKLSEDFIKPGGLHSNSPLNNSLIAATIQAHQVAFVLKYLPIEQNREVEVHSVSTVDALAKDATFATDQETSPLLLAAIGEIVYPAAIRVEAESLSKTEPGLVVVDLPRQTWRKMVLPVSSNPKSVHSQREPVIHLTALDTSTVAAVDSWGTFRIVETGLTKIHSSLDEWQKMVGDENKDLQMTYSRDSGLDVSSPKHGKVDDKNEPHVGGNTWAGGTGGRDTAGLGGKGGPYRLDAGHNVHQLSDEEKKNIPEEVKRKAREMGLKARQDRLREIQMSEHDADMYAKILGKVRNQIQALRIMLSSIESKNKERQWIRHQTSGDLDERKLIDGLTGERSIYKRRGEKDPDFGSEPVFPTYIRLVVDVSGSMYRFNGYDGRLDRTVEAMLMVMEACQKLQNYKIDIVGHSGDSDEVPFVNSSSPPSNDKERLQVLKSMIAESQFCWSGDHTIEATRTAMRKIAETKAEQRYVIVLSDANFSRYGIKPSDFAKMMVSDPLVNVFAIFIGSLGDQALRLKNALPAGTSYICMENKDLPNILKSILSSIN